MSASSAVRLVSCILLSGCATLGLNDGGENIREGLPEFFPFDPGLPRYPEGAAMQAWADEFHALIEETMRLGPPRGSVRAALELEAIRGHLESIGNNTDRGLYGWAYESFANVRYEAYIWNVTAWHDAPTEEELAAAEAVVQERLKEASDLRGRHPLADASLLSAEQYWKESQDFGDGDDESRIKRLALAKDDAEWALFLGRTPAEKRQVARACADAVVDLAGTAIEGAPAIRSDDLPLFKTLAEDRLLYARSLVADGHSRSAFESALRAAVHHARWSLQFHYQVPDNATFQREWDLVRDEADTYLEVEDYVYLARVWHGTWASKNHPVPELPYEMQGYVAAQAPRLLKAVYETRERAYAGEGASCVEPIARMVEDPVGEPLFDAEGDSEWTDYGVGSSLGIAVVFEFAGDEVRYLYGPTADEDSWIVFERVPDELEFTLTLPDGTELVAETLGSILTSSSSISGTSTRAVRGPIA